MHQPAALRSETVRRLETLGVVAVIRLADAARLRAVVEALAAGGVRAIEVTMTVPGAEGLIRELARALGSEVLLGAGTVLDPETASAVIDAGARFVVSPVLRVNMIRACHQRGAAALPGCFSPTEILTAHEAGADLIKLFPATALGPQFIRDVRAPLPALRLVPTGGVTPANAGDWIRAGAAAVGIGSALVDRVTVAEGRFEAITEKARQAVASVAAARQPT